MTKEELRRIFYALSDDIRLEIISMLLKEEEICVCSFMKHFNMSQPNISFHLRILKDASLLKARKQGKWVYYSINKENQVLELLKDIIIESVNIGIGIEDLSCSIEEGSRL
jgi:transcriptional regulator, ArsR family